MPGMMETVLNIGLNDASVKGLAEESGDERFAWDSIGGCCRCSARRCWGYRRGVLRGPRRGGEVGQGLTSDVDLDVDDLQALVATYKDVVRSTPVRSSPAPQRTAGPGDQRRLRLLEHRPGRLYRRRERIPSTWAPR